MRSLANALYVSLFALRSYFVRCCYKYKEPREKERERERERERREHTSRLHTQHTRETQR